MRVTAWKGGAYGVRVGTSNADRYFSKSWEFVDVELDGDFHRVTLSGKFWDTCPELRGSAFGKWFGRRGLNAWPKGKPPSLELIPMEGNRFRLQG